MTMIRTKPIHAIRPAAAFLATAIVATACKPAPDTSAGADGSAPQDTDTVSFLFVQTAPTMRYQDGTLVLEYVHDMTLYFSDRPERITGWLPTSRVVNGWDSGEDPFSANPPNADLSILRGDESLQIVVVLTNPRLGDGNLTYDVEILEGAMPSEAGPVSLFIDIIGNPLTPMSVAGVSRRTSRRTARRVSRRR